DAAQGHDPLLAALAEALAEAALEVQVGELQADDLRGPAAGGVEGFEDGPVAEVVAVERLRGFEQLVDVLRTQHLRDALPQRRRAEQIDGALVRALLEAEEAVEDLESDQVPGDAGRGQPLVLAEEADVVAQLAEPGVEVVA